MYKRPQSTHKLPVHSAKGFANFSASLAMLPPTCQPGFVNLIRSLPLVISPFHKTCTDNKDACTILRDYPKKMVRHMPLLYSCMSTGVFTSN